MKLGARVLACLIAVLPLISAVPAGSATLEGGSRESEHQSISESQRAVLKRLDEQAIRYFIENQVDQGLILDRQANHGALRSDPAVSLSATGMGLIALAVASSPEHKLLTREQSIQRVKKALLTVLKLPQVRGMVPHFVSNETLAPVSWDPDQVSTIDSAWIFAGALWAAQYLDDPELKKLADEIYNRVDWKSWCVDDGTDGAGCVNMGLDTKGNPIKAKWDRMNGECAFLYLLAIGATNDPLPPTVLQQLKPWNVMVQGLNLASGDLGLFVYQYSQELIDFHKLVVPRQVDLKEESRKGVLANYIACRVNASKYKTFETFWGLSAGDGPGSSPADKDSYKAYSPSSDIDGTAHLTASVASIDTYPELILANVDAAENFKQLDIKGRYGYSNVNIDKNWVSRDVVGIDLGALVMALENELYNNRTRKVFHKIPCIEKAEGLVSTLK